ncbi:unnamed protein product [Gadus morhua 'NCC']
MQNQTERTPAQDIFYRTRLREPQLRRSISHWLSNTVALPLLPFIAQKGSGSTREGLVHYLCVLNQRRWGLDPGSRTPQGHGRDAGSTSTRQHLHHAGPR